MPSHLQRIPKPFIMFINFITSDIRAWRRVDELKKSSLRGAAASRIQPARAVYASTGFLLSRE